MNVLCANIRFDGSGAAAGHAADIALELGPVIANPTYGDRSMKLEDV